jgi:hypothetical protein
MEQPSAAMLATLFFTEMIVFIIISIPFAIGNAALAGRLGRSKAVWAIMTLIPLVNLFFIYYIMYQVIFALLDRLPAPPRNDQFR